MDLSGALFLDSSALGLLLMLNKWAMKLNGALSLKSPNPAVRRSLEISNFDKYMDID